MRLGVACLPGWVLRWLSLLMSGLDSRFFFAAAAVELQCVVMQPDPCSRQALAAFRVCGGLLVNPVGRRGSDLLSRWGVGFPSID
jgi:hypothetical protein